MKIKPVILSGGSGTRLWPSSRSSLPKQFINFNVGNELAVNLFKKKIIKYTDIYKIIDKVTSLNLNSSVKTIKDIKHD